MAVSLPDAGAGVAEWIVFIGAGIGAVVAAVQGWKSARKPSDAPNTLIAADIASTKPFQDLAAEMRALNDKAERIIEAQQGSTDAMYRVASAERATETAIRDLCGVIERKLG